MIVASLLLILVAVMLLVLGLTGGSSSLLIGSIVASLLAAVALVIGARKAAGARRAAAGRPAGPDPAFAAADPAFASDESGFAADDPSFAMGDPGFAGGDSGFAAAGPGGFLAPDDTAEFLAEPEFLAERAAEPSAGQPVDEHAARADEPAPDYDRASSAISGARSENPDEYAWRRGPDPVPDDRPGPSDPGPSDPALGDPALGDPALGDPALGDPALDDPALGDPALGDPVLGDPALSDHGRPGGADRTGRDLHAEAAAHAGMSGLNDDFAEPDADDPDDEPLPQAVRPADAVRVARMDAEVLVVDGRPRYHLADCTHLVGRLTEPIPANEAVELGFSPCGLCRPVDRLVAAATRH